VDVSGLYANKAATVSGPHAFQGEEQLIEEDGWLTQNIQHGREVVGDVGWVCCLTIFFYSGRPFQNARHPNSAFVEAGFALPAHWCLGVDEGGRTVSE